LSHSQENAATEIGISVPQCPRHVELIDRDQHLLHRGPVPVKRHRIAACRPAIAEADHAADIFQPQCGVEDWQRKNDVLAGIHRAMFFQYLFGGNAPLNHRGLDDRTF